MPQKHKPIPQASATKGKPKATIEPTPRDLAISQLRGIVNLAEEHASLAQLQVISIAMGSRLCLLATTPEVPLELKRILAKGARRNG